MARGEGPSGTTDAATASGAELLARYRVTRARLMGAGTHAEPIRPAGSEAPATSAKSPSQPASAPPRWLAELTAFNEEVRALFVGDAAYAAVASPERIRAIVAAHYGVSVAEISGGRTIRRCCRPRQIAMYICARQTVLSLAAIGRLFGNRDYSTVLYALRTVAARMDKDRALAREIAALTEKCRDGAPA